MYKCTDCGLIFDNPDVEHDTSDYCGHVSTVKIGESCPKCGDNGFEEYSDYESRMEYEMENSDE